MKRLVPNGVLVPAMSAGCMCIIVAVPSTLVRIGVVLIAFTFGSILQRLKRLEDEAKTATNSSIHSG